MIEGRLHEVAGILPRGTGIMGHQPQVWLPLWLHPEMARQRDAHVLHVIARMADGVPFEAAERELKALVDNWGERIGTKDHKPTNTPARAADHRLRLQKLKDAMVGASREPILALQAATGLVLLIVCANLANLLLARAKSRQREFVLRAALGASHGRLLRQTVTEGILLSGAGGFLGLALAHAGPGILQWSSFQSLPGASGLAIEPPIWWAALVPALAIGWLLGALQPGRRIPADLAAVLKEGARGSSGAGHLARRGLVMAQVALAVMLVMGASLLMQTVYHLTTMDAGFDRARLVTFAITLPMANTDPDTRERSYQRMIGKLRAVPGVASVAAMSGLPPQRTPDALTTPVANYSDEDGRASVLVDYYQFVMGDYFGTMGIPLVAGRGFEGAGPAARSKVAIVNETLAARIWKGQNPIGQQLRPPGGSFGASQNDWHTVIGVAKDVKQRGVDQPTGGELYIALDQHGVAPPSMNVVMRTTLPSTALAATVERVVREVEADVPVVRLRDMEAVFSESIRWPRLLAWLSGAFAALALLLAALGTHGVLSYTVTERRREIGIRVALGARRADVVAEVMGQGLRVAAVGLAAGLMGAFAVNRLLESQLYGVTPMDAATMAVVVATIMSVAAAASFLPAWRAARVDPIVVLRDS